MEPSGSSSGSGSETGSHSSIGIFNDRTALVVCLLVLAPLGMWTCTKVLSMAKNVPSSLKVPVGMILTAPLVFQISNFAILMVNPEIGLPIVDILCKWYIGALYFAFYYLLREMVFFEHLLVGPEALNANPNFNDRERISIHTMPYDDLTPRGEARGSMSQRMLYSPPTRHMRGLQEQLSNVNYDQAREEETILNKVFPSQELESATKPLDEQKNEALCREIFEIGKFSRGCGSGSDERFQSLDQAERFVSETKVTIILFTVLAILKSATTLWVSANESVSDENERLIEAGLDFFELLVTLYTIICLLMFANCLQQGIILEYQPLKKFFFLAVMTFCVVNQRFLCQVLIDLAGVQPEANFSEQHHNAIMMDSLFQSVEFLLVMVGLSLQFQFHGSDNGELEEELMSQQMRESLDMGDIRGCGSSINQEYPAIRGSAENTRGIPTFSNSELRQHSRSVSGQNPMYPGK